jgi:hypothetical protein
MHGYQHRVTKIVDKMLVGVKNSYKEILGQYETNGLIID